MFNCRPAAEFTLKLTTVNEGTCNISVSCNSTAQASMLKLSCERFNEAIRNLRSTALFKSIDCSLQELSAFSANRRHLVDTCRSLGVYCVPGDHGVEVNMVGRRPDRVRLAGDLVRRFFAGQKSPAKRLDLSRCCYLGESAELKFYVSNEARADSFECDVIVNFCGSGGEANGGNVSCQQVCEAGGENYAMFCEAAFEGAGSPDSRVGDLVVVPGFGELKCEK